MELNKEQLTAELDKLTKELEQMKVEFAKDGKIDFNESMNLEAFQVEIDEINRQIKELQLQAVKESMDTEKFADEQIKKAKIWIEKNYDGVTPIDEVVKQLQKKFVLLMTDEDIKVMIMEVSSEKCLIQESEQTDLNPSPLPETEAGDITSLVFHCGASTYTFDIFSEFRGNIPVKWRTGKIEIDFKAAYSAEAAISVKINDGDYFNMKIESKYAYDSDSEEHKITNSISHQSNIMVYHAKSVETIKKEIEQKGNALKTALESYKSAKDGLDKTSSTKDVVSAIKDIYDLIEELSKGAVEVPLFNAGVESTVILKDGKEPEYNLMLFIRVNF